MCRFPIYALWEQATGSVAAIIVFMTCLTILGLITLHAINQTSSRLTWSFARDNGLIFSDVSVQNEYQVASACLFLALGSCVRWSYRALVSGLFNW